jgi:hypothetical protein
MFIKGMQAKMSANIASSVQQRRGARPRRAERKLLDALVKVPFVKGVYYSANA